MRLFHEDFFIKSAKNTGHYHKLKKAKAKSLVDAYAKLKSILTEEQQEKLKALCKAHHNKEIPRKKRQK